MIMKGSFIMSKTTDNNKKPKDNQAINTERNITYQKNLEAGKHSYSKKTDHKWGGGLSPAFLYVVVDIYIYSLYGCLPILLSL